MIRSLLGRGGRGGRDDLEAELRSLEQRADRAHPGFDAPFLNRAGDLCLDAGQQSRALAYYGRAVDAYLKADRFDAAGAVCRKIVRISPQVVRARCTLAWLSIGKGLTGDAREQVEGYVRAAIAAGQQRRAAKHLRMMAEANTDPSLRQLLADLLLELDDVVGAADLLSGTPERPGAPRDSEERWARVLRAALMGPDELDE